MAADDPVVPAPVRALLLSLTAASGCGFVGGGSMTITAELPDSAGLFTGNDVGVLGVPVGKVTKIEPKGDHVVVTLEITDTDVPIPADAGAAVVARSVATDRYVELTPVYTPGPQMEDGATIPLERTVTPVDFDEVLASIQTLRGRPGRQPEGPQRDQGPGRHRRPDARREGRSSSTARSRRCRLQCGPSHGQRENIFGTMRSLDRLTSALAADQGTVRAFLANVADAGRPAGLRTAGAASGAGDPVRRGRRRRHVRARSTATAIRGSVEDVTAVVDNLVEARRDLEETVEVMPLGGRQPRPDPAPTRQRARARQRVRGPPGQRPDQPDLRAAGHRVRRPDVPAQPRAAARRHLRELAMRGRSRYTARSARGTRPAGRLAPLAALDQRGGSCVAMLAGLLSACSGGPDYADLPLPGVRGLGRDLPPHGGLRRGAQPGAGGAVKVNGVPVGRVQSVTAKDFKAKVTMDIKASTELRRGSQARLRYDTPLGELFVQITPGKGGGPLLGDGDALAPRDVTTAPTVEDTLSAASLLVNGGGLGELQTITDELNKALGGREAVGARHASTRPTTFLRTARASTADIDRLLRSLSATSKVLEARKGTINRALTEVQPIAKVLRRTPTTSSVCSGRPTTSRSAPAASSAPRRPTCLRILQRDRGRSSTRSSPPAPSCVPVCSTW